MTRINYNPTGFKFLLYPFTTILVVGVQLKELVSSPSPPTKTSTNTPFEIQPIIIYTWMVGFSHVMEKVKENLARSGVFDTINNVHIA